MKYIFLVLLAAGALAGARYTPAPTQSTISVPPGGVVVTLYHRGIISPDGTQHQYTTSTVPTNPKPYQNKDGGWVTFTDEWTTTYVSPPWH